MPISQKYHDIDGQDPTVSRHSGGYPDWVSNHPTSPKTHPCFPFFLKSLNARSGYAPKTTKALKATALGRIDKHKKEGVIGGVCAWILQKKTFSFIGVFLTYTREKE
jgi:hypothetical protein